MKRKLIYYNPRLKTFARNLRNHGTKSEIILWKYLKGKKMRGFDFHRQKPIDNYIVDFFCFKLMLAIELDGITHSFEKQIIKDRIKEKRLNQIGISVIRFDDEEVYGHVDYVLTTIEGYIDEYIKSHPHQFTTHPPHS